MESLKEYKYFDPATKEQIVAPEVKLSFDKNGRPVWRNKKGQVAKNPNFWVGAETKGEQDNLSKLPASNALSPNQILTPGQVTNLEKSIKDKEANAAAERTSQNKKAIIKNLTDSGVLQNEVIKAAVNTEDLPILTKDFHRISKGINKILKSAIKTKLLTKGFSADEGTPVENGAAVNKTAESIAKELLDRYLVLTKVQSGRKDFTYTPLPVSTNVSESVVTNGYPLREASKEVDSAAAPEAATAPAVNSTVSNQTLSEQPSPDQTVSASTEQAKKQSAGEGTITIDNKALAELTEELAVTIEPLLTETNEAITSSAKTVKYHCSITGSVNSGQADEPSQEAEQQNESKDSRVFRRLLEEDKPSEVSVSQESTSATSDSQDGNTSQNNAVEEDVSQEGIANEEERSTAKANPGATLTLDAVKAVVEGLNKKGNLFDTPYATYKLSYSADNIDNKSNSFDILVTSSSTTPKEGFWKSFGKALKAHLMKAGAQVVSNLAGNRGHMDI